MKSCLDSVKTAHSWVVDTFGIYDEPPFYKPEPPAIPPQMPPSDETDAERTRRLQNENRHMANLQKLRIELNGFTSNTIIYHNTPVGDELVTYLRYPPKQVPTPGSEDANPVPLKRRD